MHRPYHQQLSRLDQLYLVDTSVSKETTPQKTLGNACPARSSSQPDNQTTPNTVSQNSSKPKESFIAWDQKMRQVIAETTFKEPSPVEKKKRKKRSKVKKESSRDGWIEDDRRVLEYDKDSLDLSDWILEEFTRLNRQFGFSCHNSNKISIK